MKIAIDVSAAATKWSGIREYIVNLLQFLPEICREDEFLLLFSGTRKQRQELDLPEFPNIRYRDLLLPDSMSSFKDKAFFVFGGLLAQKCDVFWGPDFFLPLGLRTGRKIVTTHDLTFIKFPQYFPRKSIFYERKLRYSLKHSQTVLTISENTKRDIVEHFHLRGDKIRVIHDGVNERFQVSSSERDLAEVRTRYGIDAKYILSVGTLQPRKNFVNLIRAFSLFRNEIPDELYLVIVGEKGWMFEEILAERERSPFRESIIFTGAVPDDDLPHLYQGAEIFVFPSFYEGFGIPLLEAMVSRTPIACSNTSSMPEVVGEHAEFFDPHDIVSMCLAMKELYLDGEKRKKRAILAYERSKQFSWKESARRIASIFSQG